MIADPIDVALLLALVVLSLVAGALLMKQRCDRYWRARLKAQRLRMGQQYARLLERTGPHPLHLIEGGRDDAA